MHPKEAKKAMAKEMDKMEARFGVFAPTATAYSDIPADAVKVYGHMFLKYKYHSDGSHRVDDDGDMLISARLYADGSHQPPDSYHDTYAGTADDTCKQAFIAAYGARAKKFNIINDLEIFSFDVPGAFLQVKFTHENCPKPIYMKLPANVNHRFAGKWVLLLGALYGLKPSNHLFDKDLTATLALAQFYPSPEDPKIFHRAHPTDPQLSVTVSMHVDDGLGCSLYKPYKEELKRVLTARYGTMEWDDNATSSTGYNIKRYADGSITLDQFGHLMRVLTTFGATDLPFIASPSGPDLFDAPLDPTPVNATSYRQLIGALFFLLRTFHDIRKEVMYLSTRQSCPTISDMHKALRVLAYLNHHRDTHVRFYSDSWDLHVTCDASYACHHDRRSHTGFFMTVGATSGTIYSYSQVQSKCIVSSAFEAEWVALASALKKAVHIRRFLISIGFPQSGPTPCYEDNQSAIKFATSPAIPNKSRHIDIRYHYTRDVVARKLFRLEYVPTKDMVADMLTKSLPLADFIRLRKRLLNLTDKPVPEWSSFWGSVSL
jgi:hypothetical protein